MMTADLNPRRGSREARLRRRSEAPRLELCEQRILLAATDFLQGVVTVTGSGQDLAGATVVLHKLDTPSIPDQTVTTGTSGAYLFQNLPAGSYQITETPPAGYVNYASQPNSPLTPILGQTASTINVQIGDASALQLSYPSHIKEQLTLTANGTTQTGLVGQLNVTVSEAGINYTSPLFPSFCVDFYRDIFTGNTNLPYAMEPLSAGLANDPLVKNPQNAGEIAYLYNHYGSVLSANPGPNAPALQAGLQLAIWELEYETSGTYNVLNGSFSVQGLSAGSAEVQYAANFLSEAQGQNEMAVYLNGLPSTNVPGGTQGLIVPESLNFTNLAAAQISGYVYVDANNNGVKDSGEAPIPGTTVTLTGTNDQGAISPLTTTTDSTGAYSFGDLRPGTYSVTETQPAGYLQGTNAVGTVGGTAVGQLGPGVDVLSNVSLVSGNSGINYNFGELLPASIAGFVYVDANNNGVKSSGKSPIPGTTVTLTGTNDQGAIAPLTTTTDSTGAYSFGDLRPGTYTVTETQPAGYLQGTNAVGTVGGTAVGQLGPGVDVLSNVSLVSGSSGINYNFDELLPASIAGFVYVDLNNNGLKDSGEPPIPGTTVTLTGSNDEGVISPLTTTTDSTGAYSFGDLRPGTYSVTETQPAGYLQGTNAVGTVGGTAVGQLGPGVDVISHIVLASDNSGVSYNFGELLNPSPGPSVSSIGGTVFCDCNNDGLQQATETPIAGATVTLAGMDTLGNPVHVVTTTGSDGTYSFSLLAAGTYTVIESVPAGYFQGKTIPGNSGGTASGNVISGITLAAGVTASGYNFADLKPSSISGVVYYDLNQNGVMDSSDIGIAHVTVSLDGTNDLGQSVQMTTTTSSEGVYSFTGLRPGTYEVIRTQPSIFIASTNTAGSLGGTATKEAIVDIAVAGCATGTNYLFGEYQKPTCRLHDLALHVGNVFYHFERAYQTDPTAFAKHYPSLVSSIVAGQVPWGKAPFPHAPLATYWVPTLATRPIKVFPVHGKLKPYPLVAATPVRATVAKPAHLQKVIKVVSRPAAVHTPAIRPALFHTSHGKR